MSSSDTIDISTSSGAAHSHYAEYVGSGLEWLEKIPKHWSTVKLKWNTKKIGSGVTPAGGSEAYVDDGVIFLRSQNVHFDGLRLDDVAFIDAETDEEMKATRVYSWDVLLNITGASIGRCALVPKDFPRANVNQHVCIIRAQQDEIHPPFLNYVLTSSVGQEQIFAEVDGASREAVTFAEIGNFKVLRPPLDEQRAIAAYLDRETERIDALIEKKERLIELLEEKRTALISRVVTRGLDADVEMKSSGIDPIGQVPSHWRVKRNKWLYREAEERSETGEEELLTVSHKTGITPRSEKEDVNMIEAKSTEGYKVCRPGDLVVNTMWAWKGALGISDYHGVVSPSYNVYRLREGERDRVEPRFLDYLYRIPAYVTEIDRHSEGVWKSRLRLYPESFFRMATPLPPRTEQKRIVQELDKKMERRNRLAGKVKEAIDHLKEYRTALISAAVTGQIDVREKVRL